MGCGLAGGIYPGVLVTVPKLLLLGAGMLKPVSSAASAA